MKRAPVVVAATVAGVAGTLGFTPHAKAPTVAATTTASPSTAASSSSSGSSSPTRGKTVTGSVVSTRYGNVQLRARISGGRLTSIQAVQLPSGDPKSSEISSFAEPQLRQSALAKQSANVDAVSGATYTSAGYRTALQSALDAAGFKVSATGSAASAG